MKKKAVKKKTTRPNLKEVAKLAAVNEDNDVIYFFDKNYPDLARELKRLLYSLQNHRQIRDEQKSMRVLDSYNYMTLDTIKRHLIGKK